MSYELTEARQRFLIHILLAVDIQRHNSTAWSDKPAGVLRVGGFRRRMIDTLKHFGLVDWKYAECYTTRDLYDVWLTEKGYRIAARCLLWRARGDLTAFPPTLLKLQLTKPM